GARTAGRGTGAGGVGVSVEVDAKVALAPSPPASEGGTVAAESPSVALKSTEVNFNYTAEVIKDLPLQRSYKGLFQLVPGVPDSGLPESSSLGPAAGGSRQDNTYLIDGVNITNPGFGYLSTEVNELDITHF